MSNSADNSPRRKRQGASTLKNGRKAVSLVLAAGFAFLSLTGCGDGDLLSGGFGASGIKSPVVIHYFVNNPLTFQDHQEGNGQDFDYVYLTVDGLKDEAVEQSVNNRIKEVFDGLRVQDLPPYRGIKKKIAEGAELIREQVNTSVSGNFNNILSITINKNTSYRNPSDKVFSENEKEYYDNMSYFSEEETLNFDLNTGEEIKLKDLFCDDADYMELLNDYMSRTLAESHADEEGYYSFFYGSFKLVEPFKGLSEEQIFSISPNGIGLVFDYRTPQFDTENMAGGPWASYWEFGDQIAVTKRFYHEGENIYTSEEPPVKSLAYMGYKNDVAGNEYQQEDGVSIGRSWRWSSSLPEEIKSRLEEMNRLDPEAVNRLKEHFRGMSKEQIEAQGGGYYDLSVDAQRIGSFINTYKNSILYFDQSIEETAEYHCYDAETLRELALADLFTEDYDYKPVIMDSIRKAIEDYDRGYGGAAGSTYSEAAENDGGGGAAAGKSSEEQYEAIYEQIDGFRLDTEGVSIHIAYPEKENRAYLLSPYITFADFGCENMNIFR